MQGISRISADFSEKPSQKALRFQCVPGKFPTRPSRELNRPSREFIFPARLKAGISRAFPNAISDGWNCVEPPVNLGKSGARVDLNHPALGGRVGGSACRSQRIVPSRQRASLLVGHNGARRRNPNFADHMSRAGGKYEHPVGETDRLADIVRHQHGDDAAAFDELAEVATHLHRQRACPMIRTARPGAARSGERRKARAREARRARPSESSPGKCVRRSDSPSPANSAVISASLASGAASRTLSSTRATAAAAAPETPCRHGRSWGCGRCPRNCDRGRRGCASGSSYRIRTVQSARRFRPLRA